MGQIRYWAIIGVCVGWSCWQLATQYWRIDSSEMSIDAKEGDTVCRPDGRSWNTTGAGAFVIATNDQCPYCSAAKPFEAELEEYGRLHNIPTFYTLSRNGRNDGAARDLAASGKLVFRIRPALFGVTGVPTFIRVSDNGLIHAMWRGGVPNERHDELLTALSIGTTPGYENRASTELQKYVADSSYQMLAVSEIGLRQTGHVKVIPLKDLVVRASYELDRHRWVVVDCGSASAPKDCQTAAEILGQLNFPRIITIGMPTRHVTCSWVDALRRLL